jgi:diaminopimelate decarboxylase
MEPVFFQPKENSAIAESVEPVPVRPFHYDREGRLCCESVPLERLAERYGTPLYCYSGTQVKERLALFRRQFADRDHLICYAVKANSNLSLLRTLASEGAGFDIVSGGELERVRRAAKAAVKRTVFSGVGKTAEEMDEALRAGILLFNVESAAELELLGERAARLRRRARIALRVNPDVFAETHPYISTGLREHKFGIDMANARAVYRNAARKKWLVPEGVSVHIGSQIRSAAPFGAALARVRGLIEELAGDGIRIRYVDAGGGLGIDYAAPLEAAARAGAVSGGAGRGADRTCPLSQTKRREGIPDHRCGNERPDPPGLIWSAPRGCARRAAAWGRRGGHRDGCGRPGL